jgi:hypothetical protein
MKVSESLSHWRTDAAGPGFGSLPPYAAGHSKSAAAALGPPAEVASLSHSDSDGPSLTRSLARGCAWRPGASSLASSAPAWPARLLAGGLAGAAEAALQTTIHVCIWHIFMVLSVANFLTLL